MSVLALLPALQRPTISSLSDPEWVAVNTIIEEKTVRDLIPQAEGGGRPGDRRVPAEQDRGVARASSHEARMSGTQSSSRRHADDQNRRFVESQGRRGAAVGGARPRSRDRAARRARSSTRVRTRAATARCGATRSELDGLTGPIEVPRGEWERPARDGAARRCARAIRDAARHIRARRTRAGAARLAR